jgi:hypothetical protein
MKKPLLRQTSMHCNRGRSGSLEGDGALLDSGPRVEEEQLQADEDWVSEGQAD